METAVLTAAEMRGLEQAAIEAGRVTGLQLMEAAGAGAVAALWAQWPDLAAGPGRALVLCGPGNNGGDGFVIARLLHGRGWQVALHLLGDRARLPADSAQNCRLWAELGAVQDWPTPGDLAGYPVPDLVVDAVFGTGLSRPLAGDITQVWQAVGQMQPRPRVLAVDIPSGINADSGRDLGALPADLTVTFHAPKRGHYLQGAGACGRLVVAPIGLAAPPPAGAARLVTGPGADLQKHVLQHKFAHGHALILAGGPGQGGAARLAARAALRIGAGLVTLAPPPAALAENAAWLDAVMLRAVAGPADLRDLLQDRRINALCLGPALGAGADQAALLAEALAGARPTVLDADALTLLAGDVALRKSLRPDCVLTPHGGEFARLCPDLAARLADPAPGEPGWSKADAAREAARALNAVVLLKGADTVIAAPDGRLAIHAALYDRAAPWLATAGAGDTLAGLITGCLARGLPAFQAACTGVWLHVEAARRFGPGLIAEDLPEQIPGLLRDLFSALR